LLGFLLLLPLLFGELGPLIDTLALADGRTAHHAAVASSHPYPHPAPHHHFHHAWLAVATHHRFHHPSAAEDALAVATHHHARVIAVGHGLALDGLLNSGCRLCDLDFQDLDTHGRVLELDQQIGDARLINQDRHKDGNNLELILVGRRQVVDALGRGVHT